MNVALAGCGRWGSRILADLTSFGARVWVADPSPTARNTALAGGAAGAFPHIEDLPPVSGAVVATPTLLHAEAIERLAARPIPVFCEKPLTSDGRSAVRLAERHGGRLFLMDKWRYHPAVEEIGKRHRSGEWGPLRSLRTRREQPEISGHDVDPVWVLAPHELSIGAEILGDVPAPSEARGEWDGGALTGLTAAFGDDGAFGFTVSARAPRRAREIVLSCRDAEVRWTLEDEHALSIARGGETTRDEVADEPPLAREIRVFLAYLEGGPAPKTGAREAAGSVLLLEEARALAGIRGRD